MTRVTAPELAHLEVTSKRLLKIDHVAKKLNILVSTAYEYTQQNRIGGVVRIGRHIRFDEAKFEAWLEAGGESA
jgi:excisionase family DNA binding protein